MKNFCEFEVKIFRNISYNSKQINEWFYTQITLTVDISLEYNCVVFNQKRMKVSDELV